MEKSRVWAAYRPQLVPLASSEIYSFLYQINHLLEYRHVQELLKNRDPQHSKT